MNPESRKIFLVIEQGSKEKAFWTHAQALAYKHEFCESDITEVKIIMLYGISLPQIALPQVGTGRT